MSVLTYPTQTITGANHTYSAADSGIITYRTNGGAPMFDTLPDPATVPGCVFYIGNNDLAALIVNPALNNTTINRVLNQLTINAQNGAVLAAQSNTISNYKLNPSIYPVQFSFTGGNVTPPSGGGGFFNANGATTINGTQTGNTYAINASGGNVSQPLPSFAGLPNNFTVTITKAQADVSSNTITPTSADGTFSPSAPVLSIAGAATILRADVVNKIWYEIV